MKTLNVNGKKIGKYTEHDTDGTSRHYFLSPDTCIFQVDDYRILWYEETETETILHVYF